MRRLSRLAIALAALATATSLGAQDETLLDPAKPTSAARAALDALETEFRAAQDAYYKPYSDAKSDEERAAITLDPALDPVPIFVERYAALAREHSGSAEAVAAWMWVFHSGSRSPRSAEAVSAAVDVLIEEYRDHAALAETVKFAFYAGSSEPCLRLLRALRERSERAETRAAATYGLAQLALQGPSRDEARARELLEEVREKHASVPFHGKRSYGEQVERDLFELEHLAVGKVAPEITGEDIDGKALSLSEYRGKVVLLDFWGDW